MERKDTGVKVAVVAALLISLIAVGVGFAAFATTLKIEGTATVATSNWDVHFSNIARNDTNSTAGIGTTLPTIGVNPDAGSNTNATLINAFNVTFSEPNQKVVYTATVLNAGSYTAKLTSKNIGTATCQGTGDNATADAKNVCDHIKYTIDGPEVNSTIAASGTATYTITVEYEDITDAALLPKANVTVTLGASTFTYSQAS